MQPNQFGIRRGFTLTELLIVISIIGIMTGLGLSALAGAVEQAREQRTQTIIAKLDQLIMERYESFRTRAVPIRIPTGVNPRIAARMRLNALRDLMRMELPDRKSDVTSDPCDYDPRLDSSGNPITSRMKSPALRNSYLRQVTRAAGGTASWSIGNQNSECLYMIVATMQDGDKNALDFFSADEIGDTDGDGMKEILDAWGSPILFLRWAPGYTVEQPGSDWQWGASATTNPLDFDSTSASSKDFFLATAAQTRDYRAYPDPFDPLKADARWASTSTDPQKPFLLRPLIMSKGRDKNMDMVTDNFGPSASAFSYCPGTSDNPPDPYSKVSGPLNGSTTSVLIGTPVDEEADGYDNFPDNITNHNPVTPQP